MAGTPLNNNVTRISAGREVTIWYGLSIPALNAIATLDPATGTPDALANPNAKHLGLTDKGAVLTAKGSWVDFNADEQSSPVKTVFDAMDMRIGVDALQVEDMDIMQLLTSGFGTLTSPAGGGKRLGFGIGTQAYSSIAAIWKMEADPTKHCIFHIFKAANKGGLSFSKSRKDKSVQPADFMGYDVPGRGEADSVGYYFVPSVGT